MIVKESTLEISATMVKDLRDKTNAGMMDCKKALQETRGDMEKAVDFLRQKGLAKAMKRSGKEASEGMIHSYIHGGGRIGVLVEVNCETDFAAKSADFVDFTKNIALHIAASNPLGVEKKDISEEIIQRERAIYLAQARETGKPENILEKMVEGKIRKFYE
jgi:elongation factor Ts